MIQKYLKDELKLLIPDLTWTIDFRSAPDHTGTVYSEGGGAPGQYDVGMRYPTYMVYIRSSNWGYAKTVAEKVYKALHKKKDFTATVEQHDRQGNVTGSTSYHVFFVSAVSDPIPIGVQDDIMDYSINFDVTLTEIKEEMTNGT
ncbi:phage tail terminator protein [Halobacillus naozhouensis]|uniref:Minor capsid protein n=1 Tax=Halobacillus naozhouensis TaxID=554880 RepID=A0ABY8J165_9BACI|nr:minor capsid protein [Halobacillus naozhouensis]WFT76243.1 minor capsid protein [Halobacillus naozhouensis]